MSGQLVLLWAVELKSSAGQLVLLWAMCGAGAVVWSRVKLECFCRVWCIASLIGLSPILAVAILRVNTLFPLLMSLAGCSPALSPHFVPTPANVAVFRVVVAIVSNPNIS